MNNKIKFIINLFLPVILGSIIGIIINGNINYNVINRPPLSPNGIVFPIVWTILYLLIGLSYAIYKEDNNDKNITIIYYLQLFFNFLWSIIFFSLDLKLLALIWILILDGLVILLFHLYYTKNGKLSSYLIIPYIAWILFATYLTIGIYLLN